MLLNFSFTAADYTPFLEYDISICPRDRFIEVLGAQRLAVVYLSSRRGHDAYRGRKFFLNLVN